MERKLRKLLALVTAFSLSMSLLGVTAFADEDNSPPPRGHRHLHGGASA